MPAKDLEDVIRSFRRDQVVRTALQMFGAAGSLDVSMEDIALEAGISRSTVYNHFRDRPELLAACAEWSYSNVAASMQKALERDVEPTELLAGVFEAVFSCLDENPGFYRLATTLRSSNSAAEATLNFQLAAASSVHREQMDALVKRLHATLDLDTDRSSTGAWLGLVLAGGLQRRATMTKPIPARRDAHELAARALRGIVSREPKARRRPRVRS